MWVTTAKSCKIYNKKYFLSICLESLIPIIMGELRSVGGSALHHVVRRVFGHARMFFYASEIETEGVKLGHWRGRLSSTGRYHFQGCKQTLKTDQSRTSVFFLYQIFTPLQRSKLPWRVWGKVVISCFISSIWLDRPVHLSVIGLLHRLNFVEECGDISMGICWLYEGIWCET